MNDIFYCKFLKLNDDARDLTLGSKADASLEIGKIYIENLIKRNCI